MTQRNDPYRYKGSGKYWKRHIKNHKQSPNTTTLFEFDNIEEAKTFAINFSNIHNIVESTEWANMTLEDCSQGNSLFWTEEKRKEESLRKSLWWTPERRLNLSKNKKQFYSDIETRKAQSCITKQTWLNDTARRDRQKQRIEGYKNGFRP